MPISRDAFDDLRETEGTVAVYEEGTNAHAILSFLADNPDRAFRPSEIAEATNLVPSSVRVTLVRLEERDLVDHAESYWSIGEYALGTQRAALVSRLNVDPDRYGGYDRTVESTVAGLPPDREDGEK